MNTDDTFKSAIQSRLNDGEGFYMHGDITIWTNDVQAFLEHGTVTDIWCPLILLEEMDYDPSLNYGMIENYA